MFKAKALQNKNVVVKYDTYEKQIYIQGFFEKYHEFYYEMQKRK